MRRGILLAILALAIACSPEAPGPEADTTWVGTITTEGNVTTVVNESGSVWGGTATLVEEVSIGVEAGADEYMLDAVSFLWADDRRIYVVNPRIAVVRVYDHDGVFLDNLGGPGQGPGEYMTPVMVAASTDGRVFVFDTDSRRINVYTGDGDTAGTWPVTKPGCCAWPLALSADNTLWMPTREWAFESETGQERYGVQAYGADGPVGEILWAAEIEFQQLTYPIGDTDRQGTPPFAPWFWWAPAPEGIVAGASDRYRFELRRGDGTAVVVERHWDPVPIDPDQIEWNRRYTVARVRQRESEWSWDGDEIPQHQPAFNGLIPAASGEIWVVRSGVSHRVESCVENPLEDYSGAQINPCWRTDRVFDAFGQDGRYLGEVEIPQDVRPPSSRLFIRDTMVLAVAEDEAGTIMVKRYRLVLPGQEQP